MLKSRLVSSSTCATSRNATVARAKSSKSSSSDVKIEYGASWYQATREAVKPKRTVREELQRRREANEAANNGKDRKDLYTENWDGSEYKGSPFNILNFIAALFVLVPVLGLAFAYWSYGDLWG